MADDVMESEGFSLAELSDLDVSNIEEVRFVDLPLGVYDWEITESGLTEDEAEGERRFKAEIVMKVIEVKAVLEPNVDKEALVNKLHTERFFVYPAKPQDEVLKAIGRIRAFVTDVGMDSAGKLGDIVANLKGHTFSCKTAKQPDKNDKSRSYTRLKFDPPKK